VLYCSEEKVSYVLSVDPGLRQCGVALWSSGGILVRAWLARARTKPGAPIGERWRDIAQCVGSGAVEKLVVERPQIYRMSPGDPNDLLNISAVLGALAVSQGAEVVTYLPRQWKGNLKKDLHLVSIRASLTEVERSRVEERPKSLAHNVWDAVGIGLYYFDRGLWKKK
jgi:hypothetical protein